MGSVQQLRLFSRDRHHRVVLVCGRSQEGSERTSHVPGATDTFGASGADRVSEAELKKADLNEAELAVWRRLRRVQRFDVELVGQHELPGIFNNAGDERPAALVVPLGNQPVGKQHCLDAVRETARLAGPTPLVAIAADSAEECLEALDSGAEEVLGGTKLTSAALERAVLSAMYRRASGSRLISSNSDPLTGLATRTALETEVPRILAAGSGQSVAALYIDLNRFKAVNDNHGHAAGDAVLTETASRLRSAVRGSDLVIRLGGDEFVVMLSAASPIEELAAEVAERIVDNFREPVSFAGRSLHMTVSVGIAIHRTGESGPDLVARADDALYSAKNDNFRAVVRYGAQLDQRAARMAHASEVLTEGIRRDLLRLETHPIVQPSRSVVTGHFHRPSWGQAPEELIRPFPDKSPVCVASDSGSELSLFKWSLFRLLETPRSPRVASLNTLIRVPGVALVADHGSAVSSLDLDSDITRNLVLVVDEMAFEQNELRQGILDLARSGIRSAVGRFGAGAASLSLLESHPFEAVWVDREIVGGLASCSIRRSKLSAIAQVAHALGQKVVLDQPAESRDLEVATELADVCVVGAPRFPSVPQSAAEDVMDSPR